MHYTIHTDYSGLFLHHLNWIQFKFVFLATLKTKVTITVSNDFAVWCYRIIFLSFTKNCAACCQKMAMLLCWIPLLTSFFPFFFLSVFFSLTLRLTEKWGHCGSLSRHATFWFWLFTTCAKLSHRSRSLNSSHNS